MLSRFICSLFGHKFVSFTGVMPRDSEYRCARCEEWFNLERY